MSIIKLKGKNHRGEQAIFVIEINEVASYPLPTNGDCVVYFHPKLRKPPIIIDREEHQKLCDAINVNRWMNPLELRQWNHYKALRFGVFHEDFHGTDLTKFKEVHKLFLHEGKSTNVDFIGVKVGDANGNAQLD